MMAEMLPHRTSANMLRKRLSALMNFAIRAGDVDRNPVLATKPYRVESEGFHTWTEDEIAQYEGHHPVGSTARLALDLMLWTGQRGGDARLMGPHHIREKRLHITQEKTGVTVSLPIPARSWGPQKALLSQGLRQQVSGLVQCSWSAELHSARSSQICRATFRRSGVHQSADQILDRSYNRQRGRPLHSGRRSAGTFGRGRRHAFG
jgi:integrase